MSTEENPSAIDFSKIDKAKLAAAFLSQPAISFRFTNRAGEDGKTPAIDVYAPEFPYNSTATKDYLSNHITFDSEIWSAVESLSSARHKSGTHGLRIEGTEAVEKFLRAPVDNPVLNDLRDQLGIRLENAISPDRFRS